MKNKKSFKLTSFSKRFLPLAPLFVVSVSVLSTGLVFSQETPALASIASLAPIPGSMTHAPVLIEQDLPAPFSSAQIEDLSSEENSKFPLSDYFKYDYFKYTHKLPPMSQAKLIEILGWKVDPVMCPVCGGYYQEPNLNPENVQILSLDESRTDIQADQVNYDNAGQSILIGNVQVAQVGRTLAAKKMVLLRSSSTKKIVAMNLYEDVHLREPGKLVIATHAYLKFQGHQGYLDNALYRSTAPQFLRYVTLPDGKKVAQITYLTAWGRAAHARQIRQGLTRYYQATYTTCPPTKHQWSLKASKLILNHDSGRGQIYHGRILIKDIPVFYLPYWNFPIDNRRKTGFLTPSNGFSDTGGYLFAWPFYLNLAPNYDTTITPSYSDKRGEIFDDEFRYLTQHNRGLIYTGIVPKDKEFAFFRDNAKLEDYGSFRAVDFRRLKGDSDTRWLFAWRHWGSYNSDLTYHVDFAAVSDDYYFEDFEKVSGLARDQLPHLFDFYYYQPYWSVNGRLQDYQTLHPINQTILASPYSTLPDLNLFTRTPQWEGFSAGSRFSPANFTHNKTPGYPNVVTGQRYDFRPYLQWDLSSPGYFFTPRMQMDFLREHLLDSDTMFLANGDLKYPDTSPSRNVPMFDLHTGLNFLRDVSYFHHYFTQTLQPELYYLYVPERDQRDLPIFTSGETLLSIPQMLTDNRFSSDDRVGDANQISLVVTSRFLNQDDGEEKARVQLGEIFYFKDRVVQIDYDDPQKNISQDNGHSPIVGGLRFAMNPHWSFHSNIVWDYLDSTPIGQEYLFQYQPAPNHIINFGYTDSQTLLPNTVGGVQVNRIDQNLTDSPRLLQASIAWPLPFSDDRWQVVGYVNYDLKNQEETRILSALYGIAYNSCCFGVRLVGGRHFLYRDEKDNLNKNQNIYNSAIYLQIALKGFGVFGTSSPSALLASSITGYDDPYQNMGSLSAGA